MRDEETRAGIAAQEIFQPLDALRIEVVRRFVEDEKLRLRDERAAECDAAFFPAAHRAHDAICRGRVEILQQAFQARVEIPAVVPLDLVEQIRAAMRVTGRVLVFSNDVEDVLRAAEDVGLHGRIQIEVERLRQEARHDPAAARNFALIRFQIARDDFKQGAFSAAVASDETDVLALVQGDGGTAEKRGRAVADDEAIGADDGCGVCRCGHKKGREASVLPLRREEHRQRIAPVKKSRSGTLTTFVAADGRRLARS